jgi:hypothetical protein
MRFEEGTLKRILCMLLAGAICVVLSPDLGAQTTTGTPPKPESCEVRAAKEKLQWGKTEHSWLESVFHNELLDMRQTWCSIWETHGYDRVHKTEDFGRVLFTGEGLHPAGGSIVPGSGFAGGLGLNLYRASKSKPVRYSGSVEARGSTNGFWEAGGKFNLLGSSETADDRHIEAIFFVQHRSLPQLTYFGLGNTSLLANESLYGLEDTNVGADIAIPVPKGLTVSGGLQGLWANPQGFHGSQTPSIEQIFTPANTPALNTATTYVIYGANVDWKHPLEECLHCWYRTDISVGLQIFHEASGAPFSFRRFNVTWMQAWNPFPDFSFDLGTVSVVSRLVESVADAGNSVPFYLQPTIGGTDINNFDVVRSYRDYRFRAPNTLTFQAEYTRPIRDPLGFLFFYDVGKVALARSDLDISHMRHSFGVGFTIRVGAFTQFKFYYAWAGREGTHTTYTGNTNNFEAENNLRGIF